MVDDALHWPECMGWAAFYDLLHFQTCELGGVLV